MALSWVQVMPLAEEGISSKRGPGTVARRSGAAASERSWRRESLVWVWLIGSHLPDFVVGKFGVGSRKFKFWHVAGHAIFFGDATGFGGVARETFGIVGSG